MKLLDRLVVITGANRGLGEAVAHRLTKDGAHLVLAARDGENLKRVQQDLQSMAVDDRQRILACVTDVSQPTDIDRLFEG